MKKIFLSAALATVMFASCQNEEIVGSQESQMEEFTVEVTKGTDSRVVMDNGVAKWSADDALYVYGKNGVRGTLKLTSGAGTGTATFTGIITGSKNDLTNAIFGNVTHEGDNITLTLNSVDVTQCDAPMFGAFSADKGSISLDYICGLNPITITEDNIGKLENVKMSGAGINTIEYVDGEWVPGTTYADITLTNVPDGTTFYVPFFTTEEEKEMPLTITVDGNSYTYIAKTEAGSISEATAPELTLDGTTGDLTPNEDSATEELTALVVNSISELRDELAKENGASYIVINEGIYTFTSNDQIDVPRSVKIVGNGDVVLDTKSAPMQSTRVFNIMGGVSNENEKINVSIENIEIKSVGNTRSDIWIRDNDKNNAGDYCDLTVNLTNVKCYSSIIDNGEVFTIGRKITLNLSNCDIQDLNVQAYKEKQRVTYSEVNYDEASNLGIRIPGEPYAYALENIKINGKTPTKHGAQTTYVEKTEQKK